MKLEVGQVWRRPDGKAYEVDSFVGKDDVLMVMRAVGLPAVQVPKRVVEETWTCIRPLVPWTDAPRTDRLPDEGT